MFDFGNANEQQQAAIEATDGPVLIIAGPGTGKTYTLVQRAIYLIEERGVKPESIFIATFTEKAAKELVTRITNELSGRGIVANLNEMYIGTFHSLCLRILKEHLEFTRLRKNFRLMDAFDQQYLVVQKLSGVFEKIPGLMDALPPKKVRFKEGRWNRAKVICSYVNKLSEELVTPEELKSDDDKSVKACGEMLEKYNELLTESNLLDFSSIQTEAFHLLQDNAEILEELRSKITHIMIDEYQDTNYIQEQLVFLLAGERKNICVVGDDDQGLYRFRGATIRNILEFQKKFAKGECSVIRLTINYRSNSDIVDFYNKWMVTTGDRFCWEIFRHDKEIKPHGKTTLHSPAVVKLAGAEIKREVVVDESEWHKKILQFINDLKAAGKLTDYNQIAFLFKSVSQPGVKALADFLETNHINVYSPRSGIFFDRDEIQLALGCLIRMFPQYAHAQGLETGRRIFVAYKHLNYYGHCVDMADEYLAKPENSELKEWITQCGEKHRNLQDTTDYAYCGLLYRLFEFRPFSEILDTEMDAGVVDLRPARNLAKLTQILGKFEYLHNVNVLSGKVYTVKHQDGKEEEKRRIDRDTEELFNWYLRRLFEDGVTEYEDDAEYAPSGCVSFLTIHQSKGMEFPIVFVGSLEETPWDTPDVLMDQIEDKYFKRPVYEPREKTKFFDFWRLYYTAFSRAQDLLVLTCCENSSTPSDCFRKLYKELQSVDDTGFDISEFDFKPIKDVNLKNTYSFTSHITVYETCARQYKFYKELEFMPVRVQAMIFGRLVHETIEDIHRAAIRQEEQSITEENIRSWFETNYNSLVNAEHAYLDRPQREAAFGQIMRYVDGQRGDWSQIQQAEVEVSMVRPDYILEGKIDLVRGDEDTVEIVDFKSEKKPDPEKMQKKLEKYRSQLNVYAYLVEERTGRKVSGMRLYYTDTDGKEPTITYPYTRSAVDGTIEAFDDTVRKILKKDFHSCAEDRKVCNSCDFRSYCKNGRN